MPQTRRNTTQNGTGIPPQGVASAVRRIAQAKRQSGEAAPQRTPTRQRQSGEATTHARLRRLTRHPPEAEWRSHSTRVAEGLQPSDVATPRESADRYSTRPPRVLATLGHASGDTHPPRPRHPAPRRLTRHPPEAEWRSCSTRVAEGLQPSDVATPRESADRYSTPPPRVCNPRTYLRGHALPLPSVRFFPAPPPPPVRDAGYASATRRHTPCATACKPAMCVGDADATRRKLRRVTIARGFALVTQGASRHVAFSIA